MSRDALVVGISTYCYKLLDPLEGVPAVDAEAIAQRLETRKDFRVWRLPEYRDPFDDVPRVASSEKYPVTEAQLEKALVQLFRPDQEKDIPDTALFYFSGHGLLREKAWGSDEGYLATSDANPSEGKFGFPLRTLREILECSHIKQQIIWLDCCHSGNLINLDEANPGNRGNVRDRCFIASCRGFEESWQDADGSYSALTEVLIQGLDTLRELHETVDNLKLTSFINDNLDAKQRPMFYNVGGVISLTRGNCISSSSNSSIRLNICPYKGLEPFDFNESDPEYFHGRTALTDELIEKVRSSNFLAVLGPSGSGKSSVVRAGLLHQLKLGQRLSGSSGWKILPTIRPGENPFRSLASAFVSPEETEKRSEKQRQSYEKQLRTEGKESLLELIAEFEAPCTVVVIDQFEELFTLCLDANERENFLDCVLNALTPTSREAPEEVPLLKVVITMRADFLGSCAEHKELATQIQHHLVTVTPMTTEELIEVIVEPARQVGLDVDPLLVTQIITDVSGSPGYLPLLQFALKQLWEQRDEEQRSLTQESYTRMKGVMGAINHHADRIYEYTDYNSLLPSQRRSFQEQEWIRRLFLKLIRTGEGIRDARQPQPKQKLLAITGDAPKQQEALALLLDELVQARLLISGVGGQFQENQPIAEEVDLLQTEQIIDLAHEALMDAWKKFAEWREEFRKLIRLRDRIEEEEKLWRREGKNPDDLIRGTLLKKILENWVDLEQELDENIKVFVQKSTEYKQQIESAIDLVNQKRHLREEFSNHEEVFREGTLALQEKLKQLSLQKLDVKTPYLYLTILQKFDNRIQNCQIAANWIQEHKASLIQIAGDASSSLLSQNLILEESANLINRFKGDIDDYLDWLYSSLKLGSIIPLENTDLKTPLVSNLIAYTTGFFQIKITVGRGDLPVGVVVELEGMLNYLIEYFSSQVLAISS